jgi:MbtH protein
MDKSRGEYLILVNEGEQYSLWPAFKGIPEGLRRVGPMGSMKVCLALVRKTWTNMQPLSVSPAAPHRFASVRRVLDALTLMIGAPHCANCSASRSWMPLGSQALPLFTTPMIRLWFYGQSGCFLWAKRCTTST